ncbi:ubiquinol-cytochrome C chaperone family protein [Sphingomonas sp. ST-64]|uniref:Ubiquinol-cytochrome C chaperone family protein n=1 Tax=Sphingomonas plantiphila TaxID=3163295 RepID=A0ABW8YJ55_9SPHN
MSLWQRLTGRKAENPAAPLYGAVVEQGRAPHWYEAGGVPDTVDGRFDMIASVFALVILRLESKPEAGEMAARLTECFVDDMDGQLRQLGVGDVVIGKRMGKIMGLVGGRLDAFRTALAPGADAGAFAEALLRNLYRGAHPGEAALEHSATGLRQLHAALATTSFDALQAGSLPA